MSCCKDHSALTFYNEGQTCLLSGDSYKSLRAYAKAIQLSSDVQDVELAIESINELSCSNSLPGYDWVEKLLLIGLCTKFSKTDAGQAAYERLKQFANCNKLKEPIVIIAGGCNADVEAKMQTYRGFFLDTFAGYKGTIVSGGTISGVSGLVGEVQQKYPSTIWSVGYVPKAKTALVDKRYNEIRYTPSEKFSPLEPIQYWVDIISAGISSSQIKLLGINGGNISAIEYRLALAIGAKVGIVKNSGSEADMLLSDTNWNNIPQLVTLSTVSVESQAFIEEII